MAPKQAPVEPYFVSNANEGENVPARGSVHDLPALLAYERMATHVKP